MHAIHQFKISILVILLAVLCWVHAYAWTGLLEIEHHDGTLEVIISPDSDPIPDGEFDIGRLYVADWNADYINPPVVATDKSFEGVWTVQVNPTGVYKVWARVETSLNEIFEYKAPEIFINPTKYGSSSGIVLDAGKPLAMGAGFYGAAFVCNAGADTQNGTLWVGDNEFTVIVPPGPCMDIEFTGSNSVPMGYNYEVRVEGDNLSVYTVNVAPELPGQVMIQ